MKTSPFVQITTRQLLADLRANNPCNRYKSLVRHGRTEIYSRPDFSVVPYSKLTDYWAFCGYANQYCERPEGQRVFI